jgi:hypothetical protein
MSVVVEARPRLLSLAAGVALAMGVVATALTAHADPRQRDVGRTFGPKSSRAPAVVPMSKARPDLLNMRDRQDSAEQPAGPGLPADTLGAVQGPVSAPSPRVVEIAAPAHMISATGVSSASVVECVAGCYGAEPRRFNATGGPPPLIDIAALRSRGSGRALAEARPPVVKVAKTKTMAGTKRHGRWAGKWKRRGGLAKWRTAQPVAIAKAPAQRPALAKVDPAPTSTPPTPLTADVAPQSTPEAAIAATVTVTRAEPAPADAEPAVAAASPASRTMVTTDWFSRINRERAARDAGAADPAAK